MLVVGRAGRSDDFGAAIAGELDSHRAGPTGRGVDEQDVPVSTFNSRSAVSAVWLDAAQGAGDVPRHVRGLGHDRVPVGDHVLRE
jgi:hypothetical protein